MNHRRLYQVGFFIAAVTSVTACGDDSSSTSTGSGGGSTGSTSTTSTMTTTATTGSTTTSGTTSSTGTGGGQCPDPTNPMFTGCVPAFLAGCWMPDMSGTCTDENGV